MLVRGRVLGREKILRGRRVLGGVRELGREKVLGGGRVLGGVTGLEKG